MNRNSYVCLSFVVVFAFMSGDASADNFGFGTLATSPSAAFVEPDTQDASALLRPASVTSLPSEFGVKTQQELEFASEEELNANHASANVLILAGLAGLLGVGMGITGICLLKRRPARATNPVFLGANRAAA